MGIRHGRRNGEQSVESKRKAGEERNAAWRVLNPLQQLQALDQRLGKGQGATRQRKRLAAKGVS